MTQMTNNTENQSAVLLARFICVISSDMQNNLDTMSSQSPSLSVGLSPSA